MTAKRSGKGAKSVNSGDGDEGGWAAEPRAVRVIVMVVVVVVVKVAAVVQSTGGVDVMCIWGVCCCMLKCFAVRSVSENIAASQSVGGLRLCFLMCDVFMFVHSNTCGLSHARVFRVFMSFTS